MARGAAATPAVGITAETLGTRFASAVASGSYAHAVPATGSNRALIVTVGTTNATVSIAAQWDPDTTNAGDEQTMSCPASSMLTMSTSRKIAICSLLAPTPSSGNGRMTISFTGGTDSFTSSATTFTGVSSFRTATTSGGNLTFGTWTGCSVVTGGFRCTVNAATQTDDVVFDLVGQGEPDPEGSRSFTAFNSGQNKHEDQATLASGAHLRVATSMRIATGTTTAMTWTYGSATTANGVAHVALPMVPAAIVTAAKIGHPTVLRYGTAGTRLAWDTAEEVSHLGFQVWREAGIGRTRLPGGLLPGSGLATGDAPLAGGRRYTAWDVAGKAGDRYWLEELPAYGPSRWHGPLVPVAAPAAAGLAPRGAGTATGTHPRTAAAHSPMAPRHMLMGWRASLPRAIAVSVEDSCLNPWASMAAIKIAVSRTGLYRIDGATLRAAGLRPDTDPSRLALSADGYEVPLRVAGGTSSVEAIEFYGVGEDNRETATRVYWLTTAAGLHRRLNVASAATTGAPVTSYVATSTLRERSTYFAALLNGSADNFFGTAIATTPVSQVLATPDAAPDTPATLQITLQGATTEQHIVDVVVGGAVVGTLAWSGRISASREFQIPATSLGDRETEVVLTPGVGATGVALVDHVTLRYQRRFRAIGNALDVTAPAGSRVNLEGFDSPEIEILDVTNPAEPIMLESVIEPDGAAWRATVSLQAGGGERRLHALAGAAALAPDTVTANVPSALCQTSGAELAIIAPREFWDVLAPFVEARRAAGWTVELDDVEDIFDEMTFGAHRADAINRFVRLRRGNPAPRTKYMLLVGSATVDPRNFLGKDLPDLVPTRLIDTDVIETASDDALADLDGDGVPELAVGRWPVRTADEVAALVSATLAMETATPFDRGSLIVTGGGGDVDFRASAAALASVLPSLPDFFDAQMSGAGDPHAQLLARWSRRPSFVQYFGHGSQGIWQGLLNMDDLSGVGADGKRAVVVALTCLNGLFHDVYQECLAKRLLEAPNGAVAVWSSTDLAESGAHAGLAAAFARSAQILALGEAVRQARIATGGAGRGMVLLGDPTLFGRPSQPSASTGSAGPQPPTDAPTKSAVVRPSAQSDGCGCAVAGTGGGVTDILFPFAALILAAALRRRRAEHSDRPRQHGRR